MDEYECVDAQGGWWPEHDYPEYGTCRRCDAEPEES